MLTLNQYLNDGNKVITDTIKNLFDFLDDISSQVLTDMMNLKYDDAIMYHTTENQVLHDTQTVLIMYQDQLKRLFEAYNSEYDPTDGYTKTVDETIQHSGTDTDEDEVINSGTDTTTSSGTSGTDTVIKSRTYDDNTMTTTETTDVDSTDSNSIGVAHGHKIKTDHDKTYGHKVVGSTTETGTLPVVEALRDYVDFNKYNFYEYVIDIIISYITLPSFKSSMGGLYE